MNYCLDKRLYYITLLRRRYKFGRLINKKNNYLTEIEWVF